MKRLVLLRHGESVWNKENLFTGWTDVGLSERGNAEAAEAGRTLAREGYGFDVAHTSVLKRAVKTLWIALEEMDLMWIPVHNTWRLNERHYGALQGLNKAQTAEKYGMDQVMLWRRSYDVPPPPAPDGMTESLKTTSERTLPYYDAMIAPRLRKGENVLVVAHGNSLRSIVMFLEKMTPEQILALNLDTGIPRVYEMDKDLKVLSMKELR